MSTNSNNHGRAYEYAWICSLYKRLRTIRKTRIISNSSFRANEQAWNSISPDMRELFELSANSAVDAIIELEPLIAERGNDLLTLEFQKDEVGVAGDVRDIVIKRNDIQWEIGLSIKHNHDAIKHSRLSYRLDFGKEWFSVPCSANYWSDVAPIFNRLKADKRKGLKWSETNNKEDEIYVPLLQAFMEEIKRSYANDPMVPEKMVEYLIGTKDYYKVVSQDRKKLTIIHTFNVHGTLNKPSKTTISAISVPVVDLPTKLIALDFRENSKNTVEMYLNNGWQLSFRIHNASSNVEPSLKFDIQFIGMPASILNIYCAWE